LDETSIVKYILFDSGFNSKQTLIQITMGSTILNTLRFMVVAFFAMNVLGSLDFGFPEADEEEKPKQNADNKMPVYVPLMCNENEYFYPGDQNNDWVCDCKPGHIYYPKTDRCYGAYRQGPCRPNEFLMIADGQYVPECIPNRCNKDGLVSFKNGCYSLDTPGPCELPELWNVVGVNTNTLALECIRQNKPTDPDIFNRLSEPSEEESTTTTTTTTTTTISPEIYPCLPGSKRAIQGKC